MNETTLKEKLMSILSALKAGQALANPGGWKVVQNYINLAAGCAGIAATFVPGLGAILTPDVLEAGIGILGAVNAYFTTTTTEKIGL